ncbi:cytochrome b/b6 domain-containing protein [Streptomyces sp. LHD-70]|uniref:cytochrome b/b6 domain-containing protein n=1 Tax=Streptomyces sp. LHD-70 TaxID=3072140 RepID=UPI00280DD3C2|nr:cytochrome b/b6 domain-containing protein [Streptomyces sp. LHD-70]MDQ8703033.1 cytochrome b/b6 domain-containing protein [Streptomyces sp. LHD-70]
MTSTPGSAAPTAATTPRPPEQAVHAGRFSPAERWAHGATAALTLLCIASAACLYVPALAQLVGRRALVVTVHEWTGLLLPVPLLAGLASRALRADLRRLDRFGPHDRHWLRAALRRERGPRPQGKFNAGQKLYAAWIAGAVLVMLGTGILMWFTGLAPLAVRTGATFVHDWLALAVAIVVAGHIGMAVRMWSQRSEARQLREGRRDLKDTV